MISYCIQRVKLLGHIAITLNVVANSVKNDKQQKPVFEYTVHGVHCTDMNQKVDKLEGILTYGAMHGIHTYIYV